MSPELPRINKGKRDRIAAREVERAAKKPYVSTLLLRMTRRSRGILLGAVAEASQDSAEAGFTQGYEQALSDIGSLVVGAEINVDAPEIEVSTGVTLVEQDVVVNTGVDGSHPLISGGEF